jgi:pimeloyl-ACP methyl ester carboxylesterase
MCLMNAAKVDRGVCVGNDFGAQVCWEAGRSRPDRFIGVFNVGIPVCFPLLVESITNLHSTFRPPLASRQTVSSLNSTKTSPTRCTCRPTLLARPRSWTTIP